MNRFREFMLRPDTPRIADIPIRTSRMVPEGEIIVSRLHGHWEGALLVTLGMRPDDDPVCIARKIVREGLRDVLAWLDHPPQYLTGREVLDLLAGRPVWTPTGGAPTAPEVTP